jgi:Domain of unknown function (DUF4390)
VRDRVIRRLCWVAAIVVAASVALRAAESLQIRPTVHDDRVIVSYELDDAYTDAVRDAIASGLRTTFTYELELRTKTSMWFDRVVATAVVTVSDHFENLTRRHTLTRTVDGRIVDELVTEDDGVVRAWLTTGNRVPLCHTAQLDPARDYYVRVTTRARPVTSSILGLPRTVSGQARFTFVP